MMCEDKNEVWVQELKKLKLTVLSKELCRKLGNISEKNKQRTKVKNNNNNNGWFNYLSDWELR